MEPVVKKLARDFALPYVRIDVDRDPGAVRLYGLRILPETALVAGGTVARRWTGYRPEIEIRRGLLDAFGAGPSP